MVSETFLLPFLCLFYALLLCAPLGTFGRRLPTKRANGPVHHQGSICPRGKNSRFSQKSDSTLLFSV